MTRKLTTPKRGARTRRVSAAAALTEAARAKRVRAASAAKPVQKARTKVEKPKFEKAKPAAKRKPVAALKKSAPKSVAAARKAARLRKAKARKNNAMRLAKFGVGQVVRHRIYPFRGVIFDIDPVFANTEEWLAAIPVDVRPRRNQPFYHLLAETAETEYIAYVSEQNLLPDTTGVPLRHAQISDYFVEEDDGTLRAVFLHTH
jgi:heat shock protein HspQ